MKEGWEYRKLGGLCDIKTGKLNANAMVENGEYPFFTCNATPYKLTIMHLTQKQYWYQEMAVWLDT